ncbi:MAG: peptide chain release factor 1 [Bdellovibrionaceae bacterium]|nr:peptide chain release factor 1 [Pseudobdellovibrionaceae bacterium]
MFSKLDEVESRYEQVNLQLQNPAVAGDQAKYRSLMKDFAETGKVVTVYRQYKKLVKELADNQELVNENDEEIRAMAKEEIREIERRLPEIEEELKILLLPKDPNDDKNIIMEIRAGAGGDEASLFAEELFRAYTHYAGKFGWRVQLMSTSDGNVGGFKEVIASISGDQVYSRLKFESGVHRVQRVPKTETQGRVHTSTITVAIIPEQEVSEVKLNMNEIRIDVTRSQGAGGQSVNTTDSAVRATHLPTGIIVFCQQGKSQTSNKEIALQILYSKLVALDEEKRMKEASDARLAQIGTGDRSERIRTYNFPQSRITDHRIGFTTHAIHDVMSGSVDVVIDPLIAHFRAEALKQQTQQ